MNLLYHPAAAAEHFDQVVHYRELNDALGETYAAEFDGAVDYILEGVHRFPVVVGSDVRRLYLKKFPIAIYFRAVQDEIIIVAVSHKRRRPLYWSTRL